jgi:hypothetical protein
MTEGLIGGEGFAVDASVVKAGANRSRGIAGDETAAPLFLSSVALRIHRTEKAQRGRERSLERCAP